MDEKWREIFEKIDTVYGDGWLKDGDKLFLRQPITTKFLSPALVDKGNDYVGYVCSCCGKDFLAMFI